LSLFSNRYDNSFAVNPKVYPFICSPVYSPSQSYPHTHAKLTLEASQAPQLSPLSFPASLCPYPQPPLSAIFLRQSFRSELKRERKRGKREGRGGGRGEAKENGEAFVAFPFTFNASILFGAVRRWRCVRAVQR